MKGKVIVMLMGEFSKPAALLDECPLHPRQQTASEAAETELREQEEELDEFCAVRP
jgi:hypothetical protein